MNDEEFKRKLSQVAEWKLPDTPRETSLNAKKKRGRKSNEELYQDEHEEVFMELFKGVNPTYAPLLTRIKYQATICDDCGCRCETSCQKEKKLYDTTGNPHWRERCLTCKKAKNPYTGKFDLSIAEASAVWSSFLRESKGAYASKGNLAKKIVPEKPVEPEDTGTIRKYPDTMQPL